MPAGVGVAVGDTEESSVGVNLACGEREKMIRMNANLILESLEHLPTSIAPL